MAKSLRKHSDLEIAVQQLQQLLTQATCAAIMFTTFGAMSMRSNAIETFLEYCGTAHVYQQAFQLLRILPAQSQHSIDMSALPLIGASPDGLVNTDPGSASNTESLLECKTKAPFHQDSSSRWHWLQKPSPDAKITAAHFSEVQMRMLASGRSCAHLVPW